MLCDGKSFLTHAPLSLSRYSRTAFIYSLLSAVAVLVLVWANAAIAAVVEGVVVKITDGDTVTVLDGSKTQFKVRLAGIDAPESKQDFGQRSRQHLASLVFQKQVRVEWTKRDRYGRIVGKIVVDRQDINVRLVQAGLAWHYKAYAKEQTPGDAMLYAEAENRARDKRVGLWADPQPVAPWEWRRARKGAAQ